MTEIETKAFAFAAFNIAAGILNRLQEKNLLSKADVQDLLDGILTAFEEDTPEPTSAEMQTARALVDGLARIAALDGNLPPTITR